MMFQRLKVLKSARLVVFGIGIGAIMGTTVVVHCSTSARSFSTKPSSGYDGGYPKWDYNWDRREQYSLLKPPKRKKRNAGAEELPTPTDEERQINETEQLEKLKTKAIRNIILIRHGQYNRKGVTDAEKSLSPLGEEQAQITGIRLKNSGITFTSLIASNMTRAKQTAQIIKKNMCQDGLDISCEDPILEEVAPCSPDPPDPSYNPELYVIHKHNSVIHSKRYYQEGARAEAAFRKYVHRADPEQLDDSYELVVCHANIIRYFICRALQFPPQAWLRIALNHTSLTMLSILPSGRVILRSWGDTGHLTPDKKTTSSVKIRGLIP